MVLGVAPTMRRFNVLHRMVAVIAIHMVDEKVLLLDLSSAEEAAVWTVTVLLNDPIQVAIVDAITLRNVSASGKLPWSTLQLDRGPILRR